MSKSISSLNKGACLQYFMIVMRKYTTLSLNTHTHTHTHTHTGSVSFINEVKMKTTPDKQKPKEYVANRPAL
jgi:hypothetical protein